MDRKKLRTLLAVAEHQSFSGAAKALGTVQSNVSAHVSRLENELGVTLIERSTNEPTPEGAAVLERARRIESEFSSLDSDLAYLRDVVVGSVRLGVIGTTARWLVPPLLQRLWATWRMKYIVTLADEDATVPSGSSTVRNTAFVDALQPIATRLTSAMTRMPTGVVRLVMRPTACPRTSGTTES